MRAVRILWNRMWVNFAISGVCEIEGEEYWYDWDFDDGHYVAYKLEAEHIPIVEAERKQLEERVGKLIYHDERFAHEMAQHEDSFPENAAPNTTTNEPRPKSDGIKIQSLGIHNLRFEKSAFYFSRGEVVNPTPFH